MPSPFKVGIQPLTVILAALLFSVSLCAGRSRGAGNAKGGSGAAANPQEKTLEDQAKAAGLPSAKAQNTSTKHTPTLYAIMRTLPSCRFGTPPPLQITWRLQ